MIVVGAILGVLIFLIVRELIKEWAEGKLDEERQKKKDD